MVVGDQEMADCLTKPWVYEQLLPALDLGSWRIVFDADMLSAKKKRQLKKGSDPKSFTVKKDFESGAKSLPVDCDMNDNH